MRPATDQTDRTPAEAPRISPAETEVMALLWQRSPQSAEELVQQLASTQNWQASTVKTLVNRLLGKAAISAVADGRRYLYAPLVQRNAWLNGQSKQLIGQWFGGRVAPLVAHFGEQGELSDQDIADLKRLIADLEAKRHG